LLLGIADGLVGQAKSLGLDVPPLLFAIADNVIEP
jgi:hypothetical protein